MKELYSAHVLMNGLNYRGYLFDRVRIELFRPNEYDEGPMYSDEEYAAMIEGYYEIAADYYGNHRRPEAVWAIDEYFTRGEIVKLFAFFCRILIPGESFTAHRTRLPIPQNSFPLSAIPIGGETACLSAHRMKNYPLKFKVDGYINFENYVPRGHKEPVY